MIDGYPPLFSAPRGALRPHPKNMRRMYPQKQLDEMAASLRAYAQTHETGNQQALHVVPADGVTPSFRQDQSNGLWYLVEGEFLVVDGNVRYLSSSSLGERFPFKCEPISATEAEQFLEMVVSTIRFDVDSISEALHFKRLHEKENMPYDDIARLTGRSYAHVTNRMALLELDNEIQALIMEGKLPSDVRAARALLSIPDKRARVKLAERLAQDGASINAIVGACAKVVQGLEARARGRERASSPNPMLGHGEANAGRRLEPDDLPAPWQAVRAAAAAMCSGCEIKLCQLQDVGEPAWHQVTHAAGQTCANCNVRTLPGACQSCPGVELMKRLILNLSSGAPTVAPPESMASTVGTHTNGNGHRSNGSAGK